MFRLSRFLLYFLFEFTGLLSFFPSTSIEVQSGRDVRRAARAFTAPAVPPALADGGPIVLFS